MAYKKYKKASNVFYVRKSWTDSNSELGPFSSLKTATGLCDANPDFNVYSKVGKLVYSPSKGVDNRKDKNISKRNKTIF